MKWWPLCLLLVSCDGIDIKPASTSSTSAGTGSAGDDDVDTDCDVERTPEKVLGPDCVTDVITCGDQIASTTEGGTTVFDGPSLQSWFCTIAGDNDYLGPERIYEFEHPGTGEVTITLQEPCGGLELFVMAWASDSCPVEGAGVLQCDEAAGTGQIVLWDNEVRRYLIFVDGADAPLPFQLSVTCP